MKKHGSNYWELINYQKGKQLVTISVVIVLVGMVGMYLAGYVPKTGDFSDKRLRFEASYPQNRRFFV